MRASSLTLFMRNAAFLYLSFIASGVTTIAPQLFFSRTVPAGKQTWLAVTLLLGTLGAMGGVALARRFGWHRRAAGVVVLGGATLLLWLSFGVEQLLLYVTLQVGVRTVVNYATQELDRRAVLLAGESERARNDRIGTGLRFLGMLLGPLWFGFFPKNGWPMLVLLVLLTGTSALSNWQLAEAPPPGPVESARHGALRGRDRTLIVAAMAIYGAYYLLASNIFYVLSDLHGLAHPAKLAGGLITTVYGAAVVTTIVSAPLIRGGLGLRWMLLAPLTMAGVALALPLPMAVWPPAAFAGAVVLGSSFAVFLLAFRNFATRAAQTGAPQWLAVYNNLGNTSALAGFGTMAALVSVTRALGLSYGRLLGPGLFLIAAVGLAAAVLGSASSAPEHEATASPG